MFKWLKRKYLNFMLPYAGRLTSLGNKHKTNIETKDERLAEAKALIREGLGLKPKK